MRTDAEIMRTDAEDLALVVAHAHEFIASAFRGHGQHEKLSAPSLAEARLNAAKLYKDRPVGIYAVARNVEGASERIRHVENWEPKRS